MSEEFRHIVRIAGTDIEGSQRVEQGLSKIKGININLSRVIVKVANLESLPRIGNLTDSDVQKIEDVLKDPSKYGVPEWFMNRCKDFETGKSSHLIGSDLTFRLISDLDFMRTTLRSWKGIRHSLGLKVRGQRTKTTGRSGRVVGVGKKRLMQAAAAASTEKKEG